MKDFHHIETWGKNVAFLDDMYQTTVEKETAIRGYDDLLTLEEKWKLIWFGQVSRSPGSAGHMKKGKRRGGKNMTNDDRRQKLR